MAESTTPTTGKELLDKLQSIKTGTGKEIAKEQNKATLAGAAMGAMMGVYWGTSRKKNILITTIFGAIVGAVTVRLVMPKKD